MIKKVILTLIAILLISQISAFEFCEDGTTGEKNLRLISVDDMLKENPKEWIWEPFQKIEIGAQIQNLNDKDGKYILEAIFKDGENTIKIAKNSDDLKKEFSLSANERKSISLEFEIDEDADAENYNIYIKFYKEEEEDKECVENAEEETTIEKIEVCEGDRVDEDKLELQKITDKKEDNEEEWIWSPSENIEISIELENNKYSERNFVTELIFLDENNEEVFLVENSEDIRKETEIGEDKNKEIKFNFKLRPDIEDAKYKLYAKAYDENDKDICTSLKAKDKSNPIFLDIKRDERKVIITGVKGPINITTSSKAQYTVTITNLGNEDEEKVLAVMYNYKLGIMEKLEIKSLNSGEEKSRTFDISIPENASASRYSLLFSTEYEYNERQDYYRSSSEDDDDIKYLITVNEKPKEKIKEKIEEINKTTKENTTIKETTAITGNVIGTSSKSKNWVILVILFVIAIAGIVLFFKKPHKKKITKIEAPQVIRRYKASLN